MFKRICQFVQSATHHLLIHIGIIICLYTLLPHAPFVMGYFNRLSGSLIRMSRISPDEFSFLAISPASEAQIVIGAFFSLHHPPGSHGGGRLREW